MNNPSHPKVLYGFTLIELIITIAIISIISMIAMPNINRQVAQYRIADTASIIEESLKFALSESSIRHQPITYSIDINSSTISLINTINQSIIEKYEYSDSSRVNVHEQSATNYLDTFASSSVSNFVIEPGKRLMNENQTDSLNVQFVVCDKSRMDVQGKLVNANANARITVTKYGKCS